PKAEINLESPLYVLKGPVDTEGAVLMMSTLKKSALRFRTYDIIETPRLSLHEAWKQVASSLGVIAHLLHPDRSNSVVHNARSALIAGIAMATGKVVLMIQEGQVKQPIDYRDIVVSYAKPGEVPKLIDPLLYRVVGLLQDNAIRQV